MHATSAARAADIVIGSFVNPGSREPFHIAIHTRSNVAIRKRGLLCYVGTCTCMAKAKNVESIRIYACMESCKIWLIM